MKVCVKVMVDVDWCDEDLGTPKEGDPLSDRVEATIEEAVMNALYYARDNGFDHDMEEVVSILPDYAEATIVR